MESTNKLNQTEIKKSKAKSDKMCRKTLNTSGAPKNPKDIEMERMMRKAMGIPEKKEG